MSEYDGTATNSYIMAPAAKGWQTIGEFSELPGSTGAILTNLFLDEDENLHVSFREGEGFEYRAYVSRQQGSGFQTLPATPQVYTSSESTVSPARQRSTLRVNQSMLP